MLATFVEPGIHCSEYVCHALVLNDGGSTPDCANVFVCVTCVPGLEPECKLPCTSDGDWPCVSSTSISPDVGQPPYELSRGIIHSAGQSPWPVGNFARNSNRPYVCAKRFGVRIRPDV